MKKIIVYGVPSGGVFGLRQLRRRWPDSRIVVVAPRSDIGYYSNCYDRFFAAANAEEMLKATEDAMAYLAGGEVSAYMYSNRMLEYVLEAGEKLFDQIHFENTYSTFEQIIDKTKADQLCRELGIPRPEEYDLTQSDASSLEYPVVVKPLAKQQAKGADKCRFVENAAELTAYLEKLQSAGIALSNLVCQQLVRGDNRYEYGYGGYFENGQAKVDICFHQFRQVPQGLCSYLREVSDVDVTKQIVEIVSPFVQHLSYTGYIEFDLKKDEVTGQFYVLDINPRPWGSSEMLEVKIQGTTVYEPKMTGCRAVWKKSLADIYASKNPRNPSRRVCREITGTDNYRSVQYLLDRNDIRPFWHDSYKRLKQLIKGMLSL